MEKIDYRLPLVSKESLNGGNTYGNRLLLFKKYLKSDFVISPTTQSSALLFNIFGRCPSKEDLMLLSDVYRELFHAFLRDRKIRPEGKKSCGLVAITKGKYSEEELSRLKRMLYALDPKSSLSPSGFGILDVGENELELNVRLRPHGIKALMRIVEVFDKSVSTDPIALG